LNTNKKYTCLSKNATWYLIQHAKFQLWSFVAYSTSRYSIQNQVWDGDFSSQYNS